MSLIQNVLVWAQKNERHLGAVLFVFGFITDLFTFTLLPVGVVNLAFIGYLAVATVCTIGSHALAEVDKDAPVWLRAFKIIFPLGAQYAIGSLLSGCLIFYTKSAAFFVSWPFLLLLVLIFIGNEYFRTYYKYLAFQSVLLFFTLYAYSIFALPLLVHKLGNLIFLASTLLSLFIFAVFLFVLHRMHRPGFRRSLRYVLPGVASIVLLMNISYFTGVIPPIPLTLPTVGIYHSLEKQNGGYLLTKEQNPSWQLFTSRTIHHVTGTPLYAFSAVSAPIDFGTSVVHVWERYDEQKKSWIERNRIAFIISGGRDGGYRSYSELVNPEEGKWRLSVETTDGQIIGRLVFIVKNVPDAPPVVEEIK